jgi:TrpR-related protein YerC/YecD
MTQKEKLQDLCKVLCSITNEKECMDFLQDLCTQKEMENMAERVYAAKLLMEGNTYNQIMAQSDISSATLSRVSRCVQYGKGYSQLLKK